MTSALSSWRHVLSAVPYVFCLGAGVAFVAAETSLAAVALSRPTLLLWHVLTVGGSALAVFGIAARSLWFELAGLVFLSSAVAAYVVLLTAVATANPNPGAAASTAGVAGLILALGSGLLLRAGALIELLLIARRAGREVR